jgi:hypothetical protein
MMIAAPLRRRGEGESRKADCQLRCNYPSASTRVSDSTISFVLSIACMDPSAKGLVRPWVEQRLGFGGSIRYRIMQVDSGYPLYDRATMVCLSNSCKWPGPRINCHFFTLASKRLVEDRTCRHSTATADRRPDPPSTPVIKFRESPSQRLSADPHPSELASSTVPPIVRVSFSFHRIDIGH